jgi:hypothetical protein
LEQVDLVRLQMVRLALWVRTGIHHQLLAACLLLLRLQELFLLVVVAVRVIHRLTLGTFLLTTVVLVEGAQIISRGVLETRHLHLRCKVLMGAMAVLGLEVRILLAAVVGALAVLVVLMDITAAMVE